MMKKIITWTLVTCLGIGLITYGITTFSGQEASAEVSQQAEGNFIRVEAGGKNIVITVEGKEVVHPLSSDVWVYRDMKKSEIEQLQSGDAVDLILNSKKQAAYIKATSLHFAAAQPPAADATEAAASNSMAAALPAPSASEVKSAEAAPAPVAGASTNPPAPGVAAPPPAAAAGAKPVAGAVPPAAATSPATAVAPPASEKLEAAKATQPAKDVRTQLDKLSLEWKSQGLLLKINREGSGQPGKATDVYIQSSDKSVVHLTGSSAEALVQQLLQGLPLEEKAFEEQLKSRISTHFQVKNEKVEWKLDTKWQQAAVPSSKDKGKDQSKNRGNEKNKNEDRNKDR
ncbi:hypothetical protein [Paenibacillus agricola]|uniref:DUF4340 domain-containing protein n=1 Tax=Paenibacillus agricola TaxID=2716264 RepID=A0ABX0JB76_9BACL|nr:hypothetical protein [Paenibacillus agricola]NHN32023.1 hypothetical protein [Paenibacillus agricola]